MQNVFRLFLALMLAAPAFAQQDSGRYIGEVKVQGGDTISVSVTSPSPELQNLARLAFNAHGRYHLVASGGSYALNFAPAGATQVTVTITRGGNAVHTETVAGTSLRNALLRAADAAVTKTSGLRGIFAGRLAFLGESTGRTEIYTGDLFFGEVVRWTSDGRQIVAPRWSPDGSKIIFTSYRTSFPDIYLLELNNRRISLFASFKGTNSGGRFSPDGTRVAMVLSGEGNSEIYVGNSQGRQIRRLTKSPSVETSPAWSPDGSRLVFVSDAAGGPQLYLMSAAGGAMSRLPTNISGNCTEPDWSRADPNRIAFTAGVGKSFQVAVYDLSSRASRIVSKAPGDAVEPVWMGDGRHVLCTFRSPNSRSLYLLDTETGKATRISPHALGNASSASYLSP
jgi:TolB protein